MSLSIFDVIGPVMHGPSSNHTGGANRIGFAAWRIMGGTPEKLTFGYHPIFMKMYTGHRTDVAMMAGCLGFREFDDECNDSMQIAAERGVSVDFIPLHEDPEVNRNTMRIIGDFDGIHWNVNSISVGGGNIVIDRINGVETSIDGNHSVSVFLLKKDGNNAYIQDKIREITGAVTLDFGECAADTCEEPMDLICIQSSEPLDEEQLKAVRENLGAALVKERFLEPMHDFAQRSSEEPYFLTFEKFIELSNETSMLDAAIEYESRRANRTPEQIMEMGEFIVNVIDESMQEGLKGENKLLGGYLDGKDGKRAWDWSADENNITGPVFSRAIARALAMSEINACAGKVVGVPTGGSAGGLPGTLFTVAERYGKSKRDLAGAFIIAGAVGTIIGNKGASFSGSIGGCQAEVGIGAGMAAAASVWLAGGSAEAACHACAMAIKNLLGLVCDPLAGPVEIPCIKRNAVGVSTALMGADMALAGIRSMVPPDEVVIALIDVQKRLPHSLRGACTGGLAACPIAKDYQAIWAAKLAGNKTE